MKTKMSLAVTMLLLAAAVLIAGPAIAAKSPQIPIAGSAIPQFVQPLPTLSVAGGTINTVMGNAPLTITMCEFNTQVLPPPMPPTRTWGYIVGTACPTTTQDTYLGPVIVNQRATTAIPSPTSITWVNNLGTTATTNVLAYKYSTDQTLHWADPLNMGMNMCNHMAMYPMFGDPCSLNYGEAMAAPIPAVTHLHGGEVPAELDGGPDAWFTSDGMYQGHGYYSFGVPGNSATYNYPNTQEAGPLWFHDHTLGATRLNVYAGLAGGYYIYDPAMNLPANLQPLTEVVPIILQDRMFDTNGQLFFQADSAGNILWATNPEHPYWSPEFVGDTIVVNGKAWPYLNVQAKRHRFLFLNGSNARTYEVFLTDPVTKVMGPPMWVIGTDGGYLDSPVKLDPKLGQKLVIMPGERYEVIIDFNDPTWLASFTKKTGPFSGTLIVKNVAKTPYPGGATPNGTTLGQIMQFRVGAAVADTSYNPVTDGALRTGAQTIKRLVNPATGTLAVTAQKTRQLTLNEVMGMPMNAIDPVTGVLTAYPGGPLEILVNNTKWSGERITGVTGGAMSMYTMQPIPGFTLDGFGANYLSELPIEGETEVWEIVNLTADAHPIHLHLVQFQLINRQNFNVPAYSAAYNTAFPGAPGFDFTTGLPCAAKAFCPGFGPPLSYAPSAVSGGKFGGNPDIAATKMVKGKPTPLYLQSGVMPPLPQEAGWKDTVVMLPGQVTRIAVRYAPTALDTTTEANLLAYPFDPNGGGQFTYVWHCHIIDHEDNEMMRPTSVQLNPLAPIPSARPLVKGSAY